MHRTTNQQPAITWKGTVKFPQDLVGIMVCIENNSRFSRSVPWVTPAHNIPHGPNHWFQSMSSSVNFHFVCLTLTLNCNCVHTLDFWRLLITETGDARKARLVRLWPVWVASQSCRTVRPRLRSFGGHVANYRLGARTHMQLVKNVLQVAAHRVNAQLQLVGNHLVGIAL